MGDYREAPPRVAAIDGLRGIAALSVAWFHLYTQNAGSPLTEAVPSAASLASVWGRFGVQLFFAISGFVVAYTLFNDRSVDRIRDIGTYFVRRSVRLDPTYWLALVAYLIGVPLIIRLGGPAEVFPSQMLDVPEVIANILYFLPLHAFLYVPVAWSLIVEIQFYLFFALIVLALNKLEVRGWNRANVFFYFGVMSMLATVVPMLRSGSLQPNLYEYLYQFLGGIFAAAAYLRVPRAALLWGLYVALMAAAFALLRSSYVLASLISAVLIVASVQWRPLRHLLSAPTMLYFGALSYCIYLLHQLIGGLAIEGLQTVFGRTVGLHQLAIMVAGMLATAIVSALVYARMERPSIELSRRIRRRHGLNVWAARNPSKIVVASDRADASAPS